MRINLDRLLGDNWLSEENWHNYNRKSYWVLAALREIKKDSLTLSEDEALIEEMEGLKRHLNHILLAHSLTTQRELVVKDRNNINDLFEAALTVSPLNKENGAKNLERSLLLRSRHYKCPREVLDE